MEKDIVSLYWWMKDMYREAEHEARMGRPTAAEASRNNAKGYARFWLCATKLNSFDGWQGLRSDLREMYKFLMSVADYPLPQPRRRIVVEKEEEEWE